MPIDLTWTPKGADYVLTGVISFEELRQMVFDYSSDPRSDRARYQIVDMRGAERLAATEVELQAIAAIDTAQSLSTPDVRVAFVVPDNRFDGQLAAYGERLAQNSSWRYAVFTDVDAARGWALDAS